MRLTGCAPNFVIRPMPPPNGTVHTLTRLASQLAVMIGRQRDEPAFLQVVVDETLHQELIHIGTAARTRHRPDIVCQHPQRPVARLRQGNDGWPYAQLPLSQICICCCGQLEDRSNSPDHLSWLLG